MHDIDTIDKQFTQPLLAWHHLYGRKDLPWQNPRTPYRVWISEIMLQQTQVKTVIPYFLHFMARFPHLEDLALADEDEVLACWAGLGYYSRARHLQQTARIIHTDFQGHFPSDVAQLIKLPGIGESTAAAIASLAFEKPTAILDGNVKRVLCRYFLVDGDPGHSLVKKRLWELANQCMPSSQCSTYTQAIMDLGATCCKNNNPQCQDCPLQNTCLAKQKQLVNSYPQKRMKKNLPQKEAQFLILHQSDGSIYLEKRPAKGIWGGLWCLPTVTLSTCARQYIQDTYQLEGEIIAEWESFKHTFTHFQLHIKPVSLKVRSTPAFSQLATGKWVQPQQLTTLGIAAPVKRILQTFVNEMAPANEYA